MVELSWLIPVFPLLAFLIISFLTSKSKIISSGIAILGMTCSLFISVFSGVQILNDEITIENPYEKSIDWLNISGFHIEMGTLMDPLSAVMLIVVTVISLLVLIYSMGYMEGDESYTRFFSYISLFTFSMLGLVVANNYFQMFVFWELVGLSSYLLIGFWYKKKSAADANKKAFITNRVADFGFMLGIIILFIHFGTFNFRELSELLINSKELLVITIAGILVFIGPMGKSGQFPFHVWLPDAMEGPAPVSALIHAATMVAAGVFLIARGYILFASSEIVMLFIAYIGGLTVFFAATIALVQVDFKRILAYSTLSQLGYMVMAMGVGSLTVGMFHLTTHAFFKALLFLCAGSVIHAAHEQDIRKMGGLYKKMKITSITMVIGGLSISGIPPFAGFWSKDEILLSIFESGNYFLYALGVITAFLTAFYMFRLIFLVFFDEPKSNYNPHESSYSMTIPLLVLAFFAITAGFIGAPFLDNGFSSYVYFGRPHHPEVNWLIIISLIIISCSGIFLAWLIYRKKIISSEKISRKFPLIYSILDNKYYIDEFYAWIFKKIMLNLGIIFNWFDRNIVDGIAHGIAGFSRESGNKLRLSQTGNLQTYALIIFSAALVFVIYSTVLVTGGIK